MMEKPTQDLNVPPKTIREEEQEDHDNCDDPKNEEEQPTIILFIPKQLEVSLKMNRPDFTRLVGAPKKGSSKSLGFKFSKLGNFNKV